MIKIDHLSWSQIDLYLKCPREWYFRYVVYPNDRDSNDSWALKLGRAYHSALETLYKNADVGEMLKVYDEEVFDSGKRYEWDRKTMRECLIEYSQKVYPLYQGIVYKVEEEVNDFYISGVDVPIHMRIDLSTVDDRIIDHKTVGYSSPKAEGNRQMLLYAYYYYKKLGRVPRSMELHKAYKNPKEGVNIEIDSSYIHFEDMLKVADLVRNVYKSIQAEIFPCYLNDMCKSSPYKEEFNRLIVMNS